MVFLSDYLGVDSLLDTLSYTNAAGTECIETKGVHEHKGNAAKQLVGRSSACSFCMFLSKSASF